MSRKERFLHTDNSKRVMEAETIQRNAARPKSQRNRMNFREQGKILITSIK
jgi:hypothetical protein